MISLNTYTEVLSYLFSRLPMFSRIGKAAYKADLLNTEKLMTLLNQPQNRFKSIHIAGTNGKGSTSHMLASILQRAGYKTGLYTSPHIKDFRERIRINGKMIPEQTVIDFVQRYHEAFEQIQPSFFEWSVGLCFNYFANEKLDIAVIETGLGGRLDSTNVITPELSLITNIGMDHMDLLGDTLPAIASEKAGIIKPHIPVIVSQRQEETADVFIQKAAAEKASIRFASDIYAVKNWRYRAIEMEADLYQSGSLFMKNVKCDLAGIYQRRNIPAVLAAVEQLKTQGYVITETHIREGLQSVKSTTGLRGRWEVLSEKPMVIADTGHNEDGISMIVKQLERIDKDHLHMVYGMVNDKLPDKILQLLPKEATYYFCKADMPRAMDDETLCNLAKQYQLKGNAYGTVQEAYQAALANAQQSDLIFVGGSTFVAAEVL